MKTIKLYFAKTLKRLNVISFFNFSLTKLLNGVLIRIPFINGSGLSNLVLKRDWLDCLIESFINNDNKAFIDVGTNVGQTLLRLKTLYPKIQYVGFEPNATCVSYLQQLIKINDFKNCIVTNCALSDKVQILNLEKTLIDDSRASVNANFRPNYFKEKESIISINYDSFHLDKEISFVKIDVEGGELEVLTGMNHALMKHKPIIVCEVLDYHDESVSNYAQDRANQVSNLMQSIGYAIIQLETDRALFKLVGFRKIESIKLKQWTVKSYELNDYLFYPKNIKDEVVDNLKRITNNEVMV